MRRRTPPEENIPLIVYTPFAWGEPKPPAPPAKQPSVPEGQKDSPFFDFTATGDTYVRFDGCVVGDHRTYRPGTVLLSQAHGVMPKGGHPTQKIFFVNGIANSPKDHYDSLSAIANQANAEVVGIYNASEGTAKDFWQCIKDKLGIGYNPAVTTLRDGLYAELISGSNQPINLMAHSQGALITSRALGEVRNRLQEAGLSATEVNAQMSRINVETFGGAAYGFPDGPHYNHHVNTADPVSGLFGQGTMLPAVSPLAAAASAPAMHAGAGAQTHRFTDYKGNEPGASKVHGFTGVYLPHWESPFPRNASQ